MHLFRPFRDITRYQACFASHTNEVFMQPALTTYMSMYTYLHLQCMLYVYILYVLYLLEEGLVALLDEKL